MEFSELSGLKDVTEGLPRYEFMVTSVFVVQHCVLLQCIFGSDLYNDLYNHMQTD